MSTESAQPHIEKSILRQPEVGIRQDEIAFLKNFVEKGGAFRAAALASFLNSPHNNITGIEPSKARLRQAAWTPEERAQRKNIPELGAFEINTASVMSREFNKIIEPAVKEGLIKGEVLVNVIDNKEHKLLTPDEYQLRIKQGTEGLRMVGVIAHIQGDDKAGANVLLRNDMDALEVQGEKEEKGKQGEVMHTCGHNYHSAWGAMNLKAMVEYKREFGEFPFGNITSVLEANEEGNPAAGDHVSPREMIKSGLLERYGPMDFVLSNHVAGFIPEGTLRLTEGVTHGATDFVIEAEPTELFKPDTDTDPRLISFEMARLVGEKYHSDQPQGNFGKLRLVEDDGNIVPSRYVRTTAVQEGHINGDKIEYNSMSINSLPGEAVYEGRVITPLTGEGLTSESLRSIADESLLKWREFGFDVNRDLSLEKDILSVRVNTGGAMHVAFGGPNPTQILGEIMNQVRERVELRALSPVKGIQFGGTMRIREPNDDVVKEEVSDKLQGLLGEAINNLGLEGKVSTNYLTQNSVGAIVNSPELVEESRRVSDKLGIPYSFISLPHAGAESAAGFRDFLKPEAKDNLFYFFVGAMDKAKTEQLLKSGDPAGLTCMHHARELELKAGAIPQGIMLPMLAIDFARNWKNNREAMKSAQAENSEPQLQ